MSRKKKRKSEVIGIIRPAELIPHLPDKLNKGTDPIVRQGTGIHGSRKRKNLLKQKTTRQYLSEYDRVMRPTLHPCTVPGMCGLVVFIGWLPFMKSEARKQSVFRRDVNSKHPLKPVSAVF